jgi:hypothetical protein
VHTICSTLAKYGIRVKDNLSAEVRDNMRRRSKRGPNLSEATGKIGQEIPSDQPAPLVPQYPDETPAKQTGAKPAAAAGSGRIEVETQPDMPPIPTRPPSPSERTPKGAPKGTVVLAIGQNHMVRPARHHTALVRPFAQHSFR